jgi:phytoene/squalene synthetase
MSNINTISRFLKPGYERSDPSLGARITMAASKQTYYTVRFLADRDLVADAYRAYGYFRWVDDQLDRDGMERSERLLFVNRQKALIDRCYRAERPRHLIEEENLLVDLIGYDRGKNSGLQAYIRHMMAVMTFDAERRGRLISQDELNGYTIDLATAVTEALHYFIGHNCKSPSSKARYLAASGAHIAHMLRDSFEDAQAGYFNIPREYVEAHGVDPHEVSSDPYRRWVRERVRLAQTCFAAGKLYLARVENLRCRMAGYAYIARFEGLLGLIRHDGYRLRPDYPERKGMQAGLRLSWSVVIQSFGHLAPARGPESFSS